MIDVSDVDSTFQIAKQKPGEREAEELVSYVKTSVQQEINTVVPNVATKDFVETKSANLEAKISETKFQIILWAFVFWATQLGAVFAFLKFLK